MHSLSKNKIKIVLFEGIHSSAVEIFRQAGYLEITCLKEALNLENPEHLDLLKDVHLIGIRSASKLNKTSLLQARKLIGIGCFCIGTNQVDLKQAALLGIPVFNAPYSNTRSVAELVLAEMILLLRRIPEKNQACHQGVWDKSAKNSFEARGKTLGIIGYGHIGSQLGVLAESLGMKVCFYDIESKLSLGNAKFLNLKNLLTDSDVISLHVPETPQTRNLIDQEALSLMKKTAVLINASRGHVVDIDSLVNALKSGNLLGAALDVFPSEPLSNQEKFISPLQSCPNVLLTPHIAGSTEEAQLNIGLEVAEKLIKYSDNGSTLSAVNFPEVSLPAHTGRSRFMHIHDNKPGVLNQINQVFSARNINISGQYLQTDNFIGYVVIDADLNQNNPKDLEKIVSLQEDLKAINHTIKSRILF